ncbi:MAG: glycosyltransferase [Bacteroidales bacterium]|nr:glycosyltransferase [Bacteroidales bacterium]
MEVILQWFMILTGGVYLFLIAMYTAGWYALRAYEPKGKERKSRTRVTIIIPARNEQDTIGALLTDLKDQDYPSGLTEIIVVDDSSGDMTPLVVKEFASRLPEWNLKLITIREDRPFRAFKKKAISHAIAESTGELIVTTDADCRMGNKWLSTLVDYFEENRPGMIVGPVSFHEETSLFEKMQTIEFLSLIAVTAGAIRSGRPIMCNGANLAYSREAFNQAGGFSYDSFSSGDDVFLLLKIRRKFGPRSVTFLKNRNAMVFTRAKKSPGEFLSQRIRWASKNRGYHFKILFVSFTVYLTNLLVVAGGVFTLTNPSFLNTFLIFYTAKMLTDLPILLGITRFVNRMNLLWFATPMIILYPVYVVLAGAVGITGRYRWKGRMIRK